MHHLNCLCKPDIVRIEQVSCTVWCSKECLYIHIKFDEHLRPFRACISGRAACEGDVLPGHLPSCPMSFGIDHVSQGFWAGANIRRHITVVPISVFLRPTYAIRSAGLWTRGTGKVVTPAASNMFFLPQKPYMPLGPLRSQLLFPSGEAPHHYLA